MNPPAAFFSCDWGTSSFRLRCVAPAGLQVLEELRDDTGVKAIHAGLAPGTGPAARADAFAAFLVGKLEDLGARAGVGIEGARVMVSGMASSTVGWRELPYARTPLPVDGSGLEVASATGAALAARNLHVWLVSGLRTGVDILRGEECEILGLLAPSLGWDGPRTCWMILPGTHSKHVRIEHGMIAGFRTAMTGELGDVLGRHSLLGASVRWPPPEDADPGTIREAFEEGLALVRDQGLTPSLFRVRTRTVLEGADPAANAWFLSGLLIGDEVGGLLAGSGTEPIVLAASRRFSAPYAAALRTLGAGDRLVLVPPEMMDRTTIHAHAVLLGRLSRDVPR